MDLDRLRGGFLGLAVGDALGAPYEFRYSFPLSDFNGLIYQPIKWKPRFGNMGYSVVGQVTDDTTMTIGLLWSILRNKDWIENDVIQAYITWANSGIKFLGKNTRALFHGIKTLKGYRDRYARLDLSQVQSNGSLMRAFVLIILFLYLPPDEAYRKALADTNLTNPNPVNRDATLIYLTTLRSVLQGTPAKEAIPQLISMAQTPLIKEAITQAAQGIPRDVTQNKGWVAHTMYILFQAWIQAEGKNFSEVINWLVRKGGDTDTNAAVAGSLLGLYYGEKKMLEDPITAKNISIVLSADTSKGEFPVNNLYHPAVALQAFK